MSVMRTTSLLCVLALLSACGSGGNDRQPETAATPAPALPVEPVNQSSVDSARPLDPVPDVAPPAVTLPANPGALPANPGALPPTATPVGPDVVLDRVDWLAPVVQSAEDADFAITSGRAVTVRALVRTVGPTVAAPPVRITVTGASGVVLASADMTGPATITGSVERTSVANNFTFVLKAEWVRPGVAISVTANPAGLAADPTPANNVARVSPAVRPEAVLYVTAVPVTTAVEGTAILPGSGNGNVAIRQAIRATLMAMYPLTDVKVRLHAPYTMTSVTTMRGNWGLMLGELNKLRIAEGKHGNYVGFIPHSPLGSVTTGNAFMPGTVAAVMGAKTPTSWRSGNMQHEMGHNFGLGHVPCGFIGSAGELGYDAELRVISPLDTRNNMMSYCGPAWISKANYVYVQRKLSESAPDKPDGLVIPLTEWQ